MADIDFVAQAPDGKEVEELTLKEINKALRAKVKTDQYIEDNDIRVKKYVRKASSTRASSRTASRTVSTRSSSRTSTRTGSRTSGRTTRTSTRTGSRTSSTRSAGGRTSTRGGSRTSRPDRRSDMRRGYSSRTRVKKLTSSEASTVKKIADELVGTKGAYLLDKELEILGKVPMSELANTLGNMDKVYTVVMDGSTDSKLVEVAERKKVKHIVAKLARVKSERVDVVPASSL